ncbi:hypothetical protein CORC01_13591 [Colletotrichum orchidophilum]|uniref:Mitochondrial transcription factor 1 n=1 Tax=Colletotrichum orchidophilum TaxID=1209926 RepID=A0A1G4APL8_9PEZI|nr:uncharacterized protein CORC01_13591 [Colletotrichum orchidophilum]OHE91109.1 hypothetical protein CORC01_13591 [Colletotrichum orchidophilum]
MRPASSTPTALILIDIQEGFKHPTHWGQSRSTPKFESNVETLLATARRYNDAAKASPALQKTSVLVLHVHHQSLSPTSVLHPSHYLEGSSTPSTTPLPFVAPLDQELVFKKQFNSAFIGTALEATLKSAGIRQLVVVGLTTDHCVSTTTRMAANLQVLGDDGGPDGNGHDVQGILVVRDAVATYEKGGFDAETVHAVNLASLDGEFAKVVSTDEVLTSVLNMFAKFKVPYLRGPGTTGPTTGVPIDKPQRTAGRRAASTKATKAVFAQSIFKETTPTASALAQTGIWTTKPRAKKGETVKNVAAQSKTKKKVKGDKSRVNIVDEKLCGPTLERHVGCDLVDINPGAGVWSRKLQEVLQPRSHILMEPDEDLYRPFLEPLLAHSNTQVKAQSGILWNELNEVLGHIQNQTPRPRGSGIEPTRNDTLLVTANLSFYPKKRYRNFDSVASLVLFQLISSIRTGALFQKYGLVRMLVWTNNDDQRSFLARNLQGRRKSALEAEFACEWLGVVAGKEAHANSDSKREAWHVRDRWIDVDSTKDTLARMRKNGFEMPEGRKLDSTKQAEQGAISTGRHAGEQTPYLSRPYMAELKELEGELAAGTLETSNTSKPWKRLKFLRHQVKSHEEDAENNKNLVAEMYELNRLRMTKAISDAELDERERAWDAKVSALGKNFLIDFRIIRDNLHVFRQDPPVMLWDRRPYEPLAVKPAEFFPNVECCLLDIQPKAMHPLLRQSGPGTSRAGDMFELFRGSMLAQGLEPVSKSLERIWPGASEGILPNCPSLRDPAQGGLAGKGHGELCSRVLNETQWTELLEAFMAWPFRPSYEEMIGRLADDIEPADDDNGGGSSMSTDAALS